MQKDISGFKKFHYCRETMQSALVHGFNEQRMFAQCVSPVTTRDRIEYTASDGVSTKGDIHIEQMKTENGI